jgi:hypothetical protein
MRCDACSTRLSESVCPNNECNWISNGSKEGVCVANDVGVNEIECWMLFVERK